MRRFKCSRQSQQGGEVVEFAIVAPIVILIFLAVIELSFMLFDLAVLANASAVGAREAVRPRPVDWEEGWTPRQDAINAAQEAATRLFSTASALGAGVGESLSIEVAPDPGGAGVAESDPITVTLHYGYSPWILQQLDVLDGQIGSLTRSTTMFVQPPED